MAKLRFAPFNERSLKATCDAWKAQMSEGLAFPPDVEQVLDWAVAHAQHVDGKSVAYGVFEHGVDGAIGICEVVINKAKTRAPWVKHLRLRLSPRIEEKLFQKDTETVKTAISMFSTSVIGVFELKMEHQATKLKVYGRTTEQLNFLQQAAIAMKLNALRNHTVSIEGRFLVIANKEA